MWSRVLHYRGHSAQRRSPRLGRDRRLRIRQRNGVLRPQMRLNKVQRASDRFQLRRNVSAVGVKEETEHFQRLIRNATSIGRDKREP